MSSTAATALSGMNAAQTSLQASAANVAGLGNPSLRRRLVEQSTAPASGVAAQVVEASAPGDAEANDVVTMLQSKNAFLANLSVFRTADRMTGTLLDSAV